MKEKLKRMMPEILIETIRKVKALYYKNKIKGNKVLCPICNSTFNFFAPYGYIKRNNAKCHNCGSLERHRLLYLYLERKLSFFNKEKKIKVLHFAPERFFYDRFSEMSLVDYTPCDLNPEMYNFKGKSKVVKIDITKIPSNDNHFDFIICNQVLEHIPDDALAMKELYRVMKPGGSGIIQVPIDYNREETYEDFTITSPEEKLKAFGHPDHVRWYGRDYKNRLEKAGFEVLEDDFVKSFSNSEIFKYGLTSYELLYYCKKPFL